MKVRFLILVFLSVFTTTAQVKNDSIYSQVDKLAEYPGGIEKFYEFVKTNFKFSNLSRNLDGTVITNFIIEKDGKISNINVLRGVENTVDAEVVKLIQTTSGNWIPAEKQGDFVRSQYTVPVKITVTSQTPVVEFDQRANYKGGMEKLQREFTANFKKSGRSKRDIKGMFVIDFDVDIDGTVSNFSVTKNTTGESEEKIIEAFEKSKGWIPAKLKGKPVKSRASMPVNYSNNVPQNYTGNNAKWKG